MDFSVTSPTISRLLRGIKATGRRIFRARYDKRLQNHLMERPARIARILERPNEPQSIDSEEIFDRLQLSGNPPLKYDYDRLSTWRRGIDRASRLIVACDIIEPGSRTLEVCCGDGMVSTTLASYGHVPTLLDLEDWRDDRARAHEFVNHDIANAIPLGHETFDAVFSYNAFEHVPDPAFALQEVIRVTRPGGRIHLDFDPLYSSAWGLHAWRTFKMPYPQFLFSEDFIQKKLQTLGLIDLGKSLASLQPLNKWRLREFRELWQNCGCEIISLDEHKDARFLRIVEEYPDAFCGRDLQYDDLITSGVRVTLRKRVSNLDSGSVSR